MLIFQLINVIVWKLAEILLGIMRTMKLTKLRDKERCTFNISL